MINMGGMCIGLHHKSFHIFKFQHNILCCPCVFELVQADGSEDGYRITSVFGIVAANSYTTREGKSHSCVSDKVAC